MYMDGKSAIVTGAGRGIGMEIAYLLAKEGAVVTVNDPGVGRGGEELGETPAEEVVANIKADGGKAEANLDSVADYAATGRMIQKVVDDHGKIDIIVNSAGLLRERMIWNMTEEDFDLVISVHLKGHWNMCHHAIKHMRGAGTGRIVNFSSDAFKGSVGQCNYAAAKAGLVGLTKAVAREVASRNVTVNALAPGYITTAMVDELSEENQAKILERIPMGRFGTPEDVAEAVVFLCSDGASYITGQVLTIDGGMIA